MTAPLLFVSSLALGVAFGAPSQEGSARMSDPPTTPGSPTLELRNRLGEETSPYLLQHRSNPVHWFPWGPEAFEAARTLDRPIFLSVGYSTCYWCHVMERESFESEAIAAIMNEHFVCIKVDREERPDVDDIYMKAVQLTNQGQGGWPMSVFLEPHGLKPFLGGTYFPPEDRYGRAGFPSVLQQVAEIWDTRRQDVLRQAQLIADAIERELASPTEPRPLDAGDVDRAIAQLLTTYDAEHGGFTGSPQKAPKFPVPPSLDLVIGAAWDRESARAAVTHTLERMALGGIYDQVGGGFHRYSTDARWLVPHFEKMLYDNGQLASTYAEVYRRTGDPLFARVLRETLAYVEREMTAPEGGFYSAQDAEVNHREGQNYLWTEEQVQSALAAADRAELAETTLVLYGLDRGTNFQDPHHPEDPRTNVLYLPARLETLAEPLGLSVEELRSRRSVINDILLEARSTRDQPATDDKILAGWNGLMIAGLADAARVLDEPAHREAAERAATFILECMASGDGGLLRTWREGEARIDAFLEDYAFVIRGLIALHRAGGGERWLDESMRLAGVARARFWDDEHGAYFDTLADQSDLFVRSRSTYDGAVPCGNSVMANNLLDLHELTGDARYLDDAEATIEALSAVVKSQPTGAALTTLAVHRMLQSAPSRLLASTPGATTPDPFGVRPGGEAQPVRVAANVDRLRLGPDATGHVEVTLAIAPGHHVNAHRPGIDYLIPLEIMVVGGSGVTATVDYPEGERFDGPEGAMLVHHGTVTIPVTVSRVGPLEGRPRLMIRYQVCTDRVCLAPRTEPLDVAIESLGD